MHGPQITVSRPHERHMLAAMRQSQSRQRTWDALALAVANRDLLYCALEDSRCAPFELKLWRRPGILPSSP